MEIHHIGYLVKELDRAIAEFTALGFDLNECIGNDGIVLDPIRKAKICLLYNGAYCVELISPVDARSPIYGLMKKYRNTPYHICYYSRNMEEDIVRLSANGWLQFQPPQVAPALDNRKVVFLMNADIGMIELVEAD